MATMIEMAYASDVLHLLEHSKHITPKQRAGLRGAVLQRYAAEVYRTLVKAEALTADERKAVDVLRRLLNVE